MLSNQIRLFQISVDIDDLDVDLLVESFGLGFKPTTLCFFDEKKNKRKVIPIKSKKKFKPGEKYYLQQNAGTGTLRFQCCNDSEISLDLYISDATVNKFQIMRMLSLP